MEIKGKKFLITGGAGFIGSHLCERLLKEGGKVVVLDNFRTGKMANLQAVKNSIKIIKGDIVNVKIVRQTVRGCQIIVHEAFPYGVSGMGLNEQYIKTGTVGTFNLLRSAVEQKIKKFIFASSVSVYGIPKYLPIDEKHPIDPFLPYGATKRAGELYCSTFFKLYGLETVSLRYFYIYGPRYSVFDHSALVNFVNRSLRKKPLLIYGSGSQVRDYTYIDDAVEATIMAIKKDNLGGKVYNVSSGAPVSILELAKKIKQLSGTESKIQSARDKQYRYVPFCQVPVGMTGRKAGRWTDERNYTADLSLVKKDLGYFPKVSLENGIKKTIEWLTTQPK